MARLLALAVAATLLMAQPGQLASAARTSPGAVWRAVLPDAPMPDAILELLHHENDVPDGAAEAVNDDDPPPPMNFNYDDYRALPRSEATAAPSPDVLIRAAARDDETVFFLEDSVRVGESLPIHSTTVRATVAAAAAGEASAQLPLEVYTVRSVRAAEGSSFVVCRGEAEAGHGALYGCRATGPARAYVLALTSERGGAVVNAAAVCRTDTSMWDPDHAAFRLLGVKPGGAAVCHAVPDALVLSAMNGKSPTAN